jgi:TonB family protein
MSIIVASVGGPSFSDTKGDITKQINALMEFLLGTGCWRQFGLPLSPTSQDAAPPIRPLARAEEPPPNRISPPVSIPIAGESAEDRDDLLDASSELRQMLTRLEINTLQVERHLESIEQRLSKMEPPVLTGTPTPPEPFLHTRRADIVSDEITQPFAEGVHVFEATRAKESPPNQISPAVSIPIVEDRDNLLTASSELRQMLTRREINTLQVERHLESIEQRLSRTEPPPKPALAGTPSPPEPLLNTRADIVSDEITQPFAEGIHVFEAQRSTPSRAVFSHSPHQTQKEDFPSPTFAYTNENGRSIVHIGVFLALLAIIAATLFAYSAQGQVLLRAGMSRVKTVYTLFRSSSAPAAVSPGPKAASPRKSVPPSISAVAPALASPEVQPAPPPESITATTPGQSVAPNNASPNISPSARPVPDSAKIGYVPANLMEGYLLSAPRPEYPQLARINHIEGSVALQATISKNGLVETLHVTNGPASLRNAAVDAVRHWQYKPYSVGGRPVEVVTTVYVHFTLSPLPAIAH